MNTKRQAYWKLNHSVNHLLQRRIRGHRSQKRLLKVFRKKLNLAARGHLDIVFLNRYWSWGFLMYSGSRGVLGYRQAPKGKSWVGRGNLAENFVLGEGRGRAQRSGNGKKQWNPGGGGGNLVSILTISVPLALLLRAGTTPKAEPGRILRPREFGHLKQFH